MAEIRTVANIDVAVCRSVQLF